MVTVRKMFFAEQLTFMKKVSYLEHVLIWLNKQDPAIQYTIEYENENKSLNFLDINITNTINNKYEFKVHRKNAITNIHIKPTSCIDPNIIKSVFKGFLHRAHSICSKKYIKEEEKFLIDMFVENSHNKQLLKNLIMNTTTKRIIRTTTKITLKIETTVI